MGIKTIYLNGKNDTTLSTPSDNNVNGKKLPAKKAAILSHKSNNAEISSSHIVKMPKVKYII